ncbi:hypothetical protein ACCO45_003194 [Purpureocillium lilacinum]|uniref:Uncharacterized protein n=1 Tax=Purpureocillium lilacinum TaxID=33203 RepID=A0ACC4DZI7_PURLI
MAGRPYSEDFGASLAGLAEVGLARLPGRGWLACSVSTAQKFKSISRPNGRCSRPSRGVHSRRHGAWRFIVPAWRPFPCRQGDDAHSQPPLPRSISSSSAERRKSCRAPTGCGPRLAPLDPPPFGSRERTGHLIALAPGGGQKDRDSNGS